MGVILIEIGVLALLICQVSRVICGEVSPLKKNVGPEWGFSPIPTYHLAHSELDIYKSALEYKKSLKGQLRLVDIWILDCEESATNSSVESMDSDSLWENAGGISAHPLMTLRMMRRFAYYLEKIVSNSSAKSEALFLELIDKCNASFTGLLPSPRNLLNVTDSIIRLQHVYDLTAKDLMDGIIANKSTAVGVTVLQAFEIGKHAHNSQMYPEALDWFRVVQQEIKNHPNKDIKPVDVTNCIRQLIVEHDALQDKINNDNFYDLNLNRFHTKIVSEIALETEKASQKKWFRGADIDKLSWAFAFIFLCNGDDFRNETHKSKLYCWYETKSHLYWTINPLKIEVHSWEPYVIQIYDVVGENVTKYLQSVASTQLSRSQVLQYQTSNSSQGSVVSTRRTSTQTRLVDHDHLPLKNLEKIIGSMTGLNVENQYYTIHNDDKANWTVSEPLQVAAYTFGGHFSEHSDALGEVGRNSTRGDRLATFMIYLNDVELGGYTAFPEIGMAVAPVPGSAVFWYDLKKNGDIDTRNMHGGCPVIFGQKWIGNKWIHENANFQKRKCSLNPLE